MKLATLRQNFIITIEKKSKIKAIKRYVLVNKIVAATGGENKSIMVTN